MLRPATVFGDDEGAAASLSLAVVAHKDSISEAYMLGGVDTILEAPTARVEAACA